VFKNPSKLKIKAKEPLRQFQTSTEVRRLSRNLNSTIGSENIKTKTSERIIYTNFALKLKLSEANI
jgi:hypothetical protein